MSDSRFCHYIVITALNGEPSVVGEFDGGEKTGTSSESLARALGGPAARIVTREELLESPEGTHALESWEVATGSEVVMLSWPSHVAVTEAGTPIQRRVSDAMAVAHELFARSMRSMTHSLDVMRVNRQIRGSS